MFSISTVASSTRMPTARAMPPSVMVLSDWPSAHSTMIDVRIDSGIETATISVLRHEPRKSRIIRAVSPAAMAPSLSTPSTAARTNTDWSKSSSIFSSGGSCAWMPGRAARTRLTTLRRGGALALEDGHQHGPAAVAADDVGLHRVAHPRRGPRP